jgi:hypothetical protein
MPYALVTCPGVKGSLYAGLGNGEFWHSGDWGESWRQLPVRLGSLRRALIVL